MNESITAPQENDLLKATREILEAHVTGRIIDLEDPDLSGVGGRIVHGVFVSLKRKGQLRSCCGLIGQPVRVLDALLQASERTALHDPRFAPIATCELPHLDCQIWILSKPEPVTRSGRSRIDAVIIGRHGLQIAVGDKRGILLPGVATDNGYDAETFLRQVSLKAGLEPEAWARIDARLWTFEGQVIEGPASTTEPTTLVSRKDPPLDRTTVEVYARYAADAIRAELGSQPRILHLGSTPSRSISGLILRFKGSGQLDLTRGQIVLNKGTDFHEMLESLIGQIVAGCQEVGNRDLELTGARVELTVVDDTALHGTVANPDLEGIDANERSLMVIQGHQFAFLHDNGCTAKNLLERTLQIGEIFHSSGARIYSFRSRSNVRTSQLSRVPAGSAGTRQRPPAVAGSFYPSDPVMLDDMTTRLLGPVENRIQTHRFPGAMVPHAALRFSGQIAADTLKRIDFPSRILILCPHHTGRGVSCAVAPHLSWGLPGNPVDSDGDMARSLSHAIPGFKLDAAAHEREHAIEVQLPLIRKLAPTAKVVGVTIGHQPLETLRGYGISLAEWLEKLEDPPLLLISSDMNHFDQDERNRELDAFALDAMETLDPDQLYRSVTSRSISMCGMAPAVIILHALKKLGLLNRMIRTGYGTSAETTGDQSRVVGYAGALFE